MATHTKEQRKFIAGRLGAFDPLNTIVARFKARWPDTACDLSDVEACDPNRQVLDPDIYQAFRDSRTRLVESEDAAPTADRRVRLVELHRMFETAKNRNAYGEMLEVLGRIRIEMDGEAGSASAQITAIEHVFIEPEKPVETP